MSTSDLNPRPRRRLLLERLEDRLLFDGVAAAPDAMQPETAQVEVAQMAEYEATAEINDGQSAVNDSAPEGTGSPEPSRALAAELLNTIDSLLITVDGELAQSAPSETVESTATLAIEESIIAQVEQSVVVPDNPMSRREIVFISTDVYDYEYLSLNLPESVQVALITSDRDGMEQIADALRGESNVDAIHIISHGRAGALFLGGSTVDTASLSGEYADELAIIRAALSDNADVLVYGCNVADGNIGQNFVDALADQAGADIVASTNATGAETKGGDWVLEKTTGTVTTQSLQVKTWDGLLAPISITNVTGTAAVAGTTLATNILGNGITLNSATFSGDNSQAGTFTSATGYTPEWLGYGSGILLSTGNTSQVVGPNTAEGSTVDAPGGLVDTDLGLLGQGTSFDATSLTLTFTPTSNRVTLQFTFGSDEYNEYVYSAFNDAMGIWVNGQQMAILPTGETISVNSVNRAATFNPANGNQSRDPFPGNGIFDSASPSLYKSNSVASAAFNTSMDGFTVTMSIIADVTAGVSNTIKIGITDIQDAAWDSWLFIRSASFEAETIAYTDNVTTTVNTPVTIDAKANDWDLQGHALTITHIADIPVTAGGAAVTLGSGATAQLTATGQILYTPLTGSTQNDIFTYTIQDTTGTTAVGFINVAIPAPPTVDLNDNGTTTDRNNAVTYGLNGTAVAVATSSASVADVNDPTYPLLTLGLGGFVNGSSEILNIGGTDFAYGTAQTSNLTVSGTAITVTYNGANSITVARTAMGAEISDALMETIIRGVTYRNTATNGTFGDRTINFTVNDGTSNSNTATATISVVNAVPVIDLNDNGTTAARDNAVTFTEGNSPVNIATSTASVIDSNDLTYPSLSITLGGFVGGSSERISIGGTEFTYGTALTTTVTVGSTTFRVAYNGANGIAITNNASGVEMPDPDVETLVRGITYRHLPGVVTSGARTMSFVVNDGTVNSSPAVATINVVGTPMAPTIDLNGNDVGTSGNVRDTFESVAYNRNDGTLTWSTNWTEGPSATDAATGDVRIVTDGTANVLRLGDDAANGQADTIRRSANLSAYTSAVLSLDYRRVALDDGTNDFILIEASSDGTTFTQVGRIEGPTNDATYQSFLVNISAYISANTTIRFTAPTSLGNTDFVLIDNVNIAVSAAAPTSHATSYQIGNPPVRIGSTTGAGVVVTDVNENITQAVVTLTNPQTGDALSVAGTLPSGITATVSGGGSIVTLSGYGSPAMYKQAIEAIGFANSNPSASLVNRTITVQLTDSTAFTSNTATTTITMIGNAAPTIDLDGGTTGNNYSTSCTEDGAAAPVVNTSAVITDTDDANMESATVVLTNAFAGDVLSFGTLPAGIVGSVNTSVAGQITVTLTGSATRADYVTALRAITYSTTSNTPNTSTRTINITVNDGAANSNTATTSITVANNNDAPTTTNDSVTTPEDVTIVLGLGDFGTYSDPEGTAIASVRITSLPTTGALQFFNGTAWVAVATNQTVTAANITAGNLRFVPVAQQNGSPYTTIGFQVSDGSLFSATSTLTVNVTPVNDAPTSTALVNRTNADGATVSVNLSGSFSDIDAGDTLTFSATGLPAGLSINPTTGVISGTVASNASVGGPYSVTITATDSGSATTSQSFTWTVTNPAPTAVADAGATTENSSISGNVLTNDTDPDNDTLTVSAVNGLGANIGIALAGSNGGTFTIGSNGAYSFNPGTAFDNLAVGQTRTTAVSYTATDSQGGTSTTTLTISVTGTNDGPVSMAISNQSNSDGAAVTLNVSGNFSDPDTGDALTFSASGLPAGLSINPTTGVITGTIANNASVSGPFAVSVTATDPHGATSTRNFTWTVNNPALTAVADTGATTENANTSGDVITNDTDPDNDVLTVSAVNGSGANLGVAVAGTNGGTFTIGTTGAYSFNPGTAFDDLAVGQTRATSVTYIATDSQGGTSSATLTITVTGTNDAPTSTAIANQTNADGSTVSLNVAGNFSDADTTNTLTFSATGLPSGLSINPTTGLISGTIASNASVSGPYSVIVTATDNASATTSQTFTWTVTNPAPTATNDSAATTENATISGSVLSNDTDPDNDTLTVLAVNGVPGNVAGSVAGLNGGTFTVNANGTYSFSPGTAFDDLAAGETRTTNVQYTVTDSQGGSSTATLTVTVTGTNNAPTSTSIANQSNVDGATVSLNVAGQFSDLDATNTLTYSASGLPSGLSINLTTGLISGTIANNASMTGPYSVTVNATDNASATTSQTFTWTVTNPAPTATNDIATITSNATASGNVLTNDSDPDNDSLSVSSVNGSPANIGTSVSGSNGGTFTIDASGALTFNPGSDFDSLGAGATATTTVTYQMTDSQGGFSTATVTITVTGINSAPVSTPIAAQSSIDGGSVTLNVSGNFSDPDAGDLLTFSASSLPPGLSINSTTGIISGTINNNASVGGPYSVTITATDIAGATTSQTFTWTVSNPAPAATNDTTATTENASSSGNVLTNDSDPDGDTLTVSAVNGGAGNVGNPIAGTNGGSFTISSTGAYTFHPGAAFDDLAVGQTRTTSVDYIATDSQGGTSTATLTVTVTGTNDAPTAVGTMTGQSNVDSAVVSLNVSGFFADADTTDVLSFSASVLPTGLSINASTGVISGTINSSASASGPFSVVVTANDGNGGTVNQSFTWIVTNPAPIANNDSFSIGEDASASVVGNALTNDSDPDGDAFSANVQTSVAGSNGGVFSIAANGNVTFNPNGAFNDLAAGQTRTTTLNYVITDANGATSSATITVTVNGANDSPTSTPIANQTIADAATVSLNVASNFSDPDTTNTLTYAASGLPSGLSINTTTGLISGTIANNASVTGPYSVIVTATDIAGATASQNFTWTVTNPAPTAVSDSGATTENATTSDNVITNDTDPDNDTLTVSAVNGVGANVGGPVTGTNGGTFTIGSDGAYSFSPGTAFNDLAVGQTRTTSVTYTATDSQGGSSSTTLTITVTGTNDAPVSTALSNRTNADGSAVSVNVSGNFFDPDGTDTLTFSASGLPAGLSINPTSGIISGTIASNASVSGPFSVSVTATDPHGATTTRNFTWTVTNPAPTAVADAGSTNENANATGNVLTNDTDPDNDTLTVATINGSGTNVGIAIAGANGGTFTINANGDYSFNPGTAFDDLALGQSRSTSVTYTATDSQGGTSSTTLTITVNGTNDAPTSTSIANQNSSDAASVTLNVSGNFADVDAGSVLAYSASGLPSGLTINASTGIISGTIASNASVTSPYSVTVTATDAHGASTSQNFSWTVTNPAPTAVSNSVATTENSSTSGNVLTNDTDPDNDTLSVSAVNGLAAGVNTNVAGSAGGTFVIASNGAFMFNPGTAFDDLAFGETRDTSVSYTATDSQGGSSTTTLTVTVTGTNDAPTSTAIGNQSSVDAANVTLDVSGFFDDLDATDVLTYSASGLPSGLTINTASGIITGTIANSASVTGPYSVEVTATDSQGATTTQTVTWAVTNPGPSATADSYATTENSTVSGNVLTNDTDPDSDVLTVSAVNGSGTNVGTSVTGSNGGTFTIASNGAYSFNPGAAFDDLGVGETRTTTVQYTTTDSQGGFSTTTVTIEVDGQNDGPTSTAIGNRTSVDGATVSLNVRSRFSDVDATDVLTFAASGLPTGLSINATTGVISGTIANNASLTAPYSVTVTATDGSGANTSRIFTWNVTNPAPTASNDSATVAINTTGSGNVLTNDTDPDNDALTVVSVNGSGPSVGNNVAGTTGGTFTVLANGNYSFDPGADFDSLAAGESRTTSITYTMSDSQGGSSTATVTVTVTGLNASPVGTAIANQTNSDAASVSLNVAGNFSDPNASDVLTFAASGLPSGLSINATTGLISGTIANNASISGPYSVTITATDNHGASTSQSFTWTVTNPAPTATDDSRTTAENSTASGNVLTNDTDPDNDVLTVASVNGAAGNVANSVTGTNGGSFAINSDGSYTFNPGTAFDDLAVGQTRTTSVTYLATDSQGGTSSAVLVVTVVGANDAPTSTAVAAQTSADAQTVSLNVAGSFSDADTTDTLTFAASGLPSGLSINTTTGLISGTIANNASVTSPYSVTVTATDNHGATTSQTFAWTVTNPGPTAVADTGTALENGSATGNVLTNDTDPDNDDLTVATVNGSGANVGTSVAGTNGGSFTITDTGGYSFNPGTAFDDLAVGQSRTTSVTYTATDSQGGTSSTTLTITVTGTNDGPVSSSLANRSSADGSTVSVNVSGNFSDPDNTDALTFAASGLPSGLSINPTTGLISGTIASNASVTGPYNVVVTATDPHGATTSQSFVWTVTNPAPAANNDGGATMENSTVSGNVLTNDSDPDNDVLTVAAVNGVAGEVAGAVPGSNGGTFTINANGTYSFVPGTAFDNLAAGETRTTSVQYTATDSQGGTSTATLTVTVTGTNDAPASTAIANQSNIDGASVSLNVAGQFSDVDASNVLTFSASGLPSGLSINSATGLISGAIANNASVSGPYSVTVTATDNAGATTSQMFNWIVTNPAPTASNDSATIASDDTASGNVQTNDTDPDNDALSVSAVNGNGANVGSSIAGTNGGSFSIGNNGAWTFNPGTDFDSLGAGQSQTTSITYTMTDSQGGSSTATVTVTVTGLNSAPTSTPIANQTGVDAGSVTLNVSGNFSDTDNGDTLTYTASGLPSGLSINPTTGVITGTIASNASVTGPYSVTITATDSGNATTSQSFIWTVTNPAPTASNDTRTTSENSTTSGNVLTNDTDPDNDTLTVSAINGVNTNVGNAVAGSNGGTFTIGSNGAYSFNPGTAFDNLAVGQTRTTSVTYTATDSQGGTSTATLTITVTGTNDGPVSTAISNQSSSDGSSVTVNVSGNFSDPDTGDALTFSASGLPSGLSINPTTGIISGTIANSASVSGPFAVSVTATDPHGATTTRNFTWTVTNPAPTAVADARTTSENTSTSGNVLTNDTDPDNDVLTVSAVNGTVTNVGAAVTGTNGGTFTIESTGVYTFNLGSSFDDLAVGQTRTTSVTYTATDSQGGTSSTTLTITVTGANDGPASTAIAAQSSADAQSISLNVSGNFADPDAGAVLAYSANGLPSGLSINPATGIISGTIASNASLTGPYSVTVTATDEHGAATSQTFAWAVSNPGPTAVADTRTTSENNSTSGNVLTNDTDPDNDTLSVASVNGVTTNVGAAVAGSTGGTFVINSNGTYTFNPGTAFDDLAVGQARTSTVTYAATDSQGGTSSTTLTITVTGSNDAPVSTAISTQNSSDGSSVVLNVAGSFIDPDTTDPLTFSATGLPSGLSIHPTTGVISGTIANNASVSGPYSVVVTADDPHGGTTSQTFVWNVTNPAPTANNDAATVNGNSTSSGNVLSNDTDPDGDTLTVQSVNGLSSNVNNAVAGSNGGTFTIQPNGSYVFNPGSSFDDLAVGETRTSSVTYTMTDNQGGTSTATVTVTISGLNDAPTSTPISTQNGIDNTPVTLNVSSSFGDPDASDPLTFSASNLPPGLSINPTTGIISGTIAGNASVSGPYSVTITAVDPHGATTSQTFTWNVSNPAPTATNDAATTNENASTTGNVLTNDTDPDGDTLVVSAVNGSPASIGTPISGSQGGTFTIQPNGSYSFQPGTAFDDLAVGQTRTTSITYTVSDNQGGTSTATVTVTVVGRNDTPTSTPIGTQSANDGDSIALSIASHFGDPDTTDMLTFSAGNLPPGLAIDPSTGLIHGTINSNVSVSGPYSVTVTATDPHGATSSQTFMWNVANPAPTATNDPATTPENSSITGNVLTNDTDPDNDGLVVSSVNGSSSNLGRPISGTTGGTFVIQSNGGYSFNPGTSFDHLGVGQSIITSVTYTVSDGQGGTSTATVSITVTGTNDTPIVAAIPAQDSTGRDVINLDVSSFFSDAETHEPLTFAASNLPPGLSINPTTGLITGSIDPNAASTGPYSVTVTGTDIHGASVTTSFQWNVENPDLMVLVNDSVPSVNAGDTVVFSVNYANISNRDASGVVITQTLPAHTTFNSAASTAGWINNGDGTYSYALGNVDAYDNGTILFAVTVADTLPSGIDQTSTSSTIADDGSHGNDLTPSNNIASDMTSIDARPDYRITIDDSKVLVYRGETLTYNIYVSNNGSQNGTGVVVTSYYPPEVLGSITASHGGVIDTLAGTITWNLGTLPAGSDVNLTVSGVIPMNAPTSILNFAQYVTVTDDGSTGADRTPSNNSASDSNFLMSFGFDSFGNRSQEGFGMIPPSAPPLTTKLMPLPVDPIFSGITEPGTTLVGKIYDQHGNLIGERQIVADSSGNWMMSFPNSIVMENPHRMEVQQTAALQSGNHSGFNFRRYFHPTAHSSIFFSTELSVNEVFRRSAYQMIDQLHEGNESPYGFNWFALAYELAMASSNAGEG